jgi:carbon starvation protein
MVGAWGYFLIQGVRDPLGGINSLWPLFGIANQMLAAIALCLGTTIILKMQLGRDGVSPSPIEAQKTESMGQRHAVPPKGKPTLALITLIPLIWLVAVTFTASVQKIWHPDPRIGFLSQANILHQKTPALAGNFRAAKSAGDIIAINAAENALRANRMLEFNNVLDAVVAGTFLVLVAAIILVSVREWVLLLARRKAAALHETEPVWLPDYAVKEAGPDLRTAAGAAVIALGLVKELSGESHFERARQQACICAQPSDKQIYAQVTEERFNGIRRCC